ncbi:MAG: hypothetical protein ACJAVM_003021 [Sulfitobacter sp.]|jgi:hypothetical protein
MTNTINPAQLSADLGGKWHGGYGVAPCPVCQPTRRKDHNALTISAKDDRLLLHCKKSGCDFKDILMASGITPGTVEIDQMALANGQRERKEQAAKLKARARSVWGHGQPILGTHGEQYLRGRGITCALPDTLRWLPDAYHGPSGQYCAAMVSDVAPTGGIHRTFFTKNGQRLEKSAKMMLGACSGGAVRLSDAVGPLVVCEGIETGLSLLSGLLSGPHVVWAALSTSGIKGLTLPKRPGQLIIASDGDEAGRAAASSLARSAHALGWDVSLMPAPEDHDWNDVLQGEAAA